MKPPIWRQVQVPSEGTLCLLNRVLLAAFEWSGEHLHEFVVGQRAYRHDAEEPGFGDEHDVTLADVLRRKGSRLLYAYDFDDDWRVDVTVKAIETASWAEGGAVRPRLLGGARAAPPEDCGGVGRYALLCAASLDPAHPRRDELLEPFEGEPLDPEAFDQARVARAVAHQVEALDFDEEAELLDTEDGDEEGDEEGDVEDAGAD